MMRKIFYDAEYDMWFETEEALEAMERSRDWHKFFFNFLIPLVIVVMYGWTALILLH